MASPSVTFIIPVLNEEGRIGPLLELLEACHPDSQRLVVDGGSTDATVAQARPHCHCVIESEAGRATQMNEGAKVATGNYLFFLHADTLPTITAHELRRCLASGPQWGFFNVKLSGSQGVFRLVEWAMNTRSRLSSVATGDQMIFVQRELFHHTGGYAPIPLMEDVEYCKRLRRVHHPLMLQPHVETSSRRWEQQGIASTIVRMWSLRLAYFLGVSPQRLRGHYSSD